MRTFPSSAPLSDGQAAGVLVVLATCCEGTALGGMCTCMHAEANMSAARELEGDEGHDDLVSAPKMVLHGFITKHLFKGFADQPYAYLNRLLAQVGRVVAAPAAAPAAALTVQPPIALHCNFGSLHLCSFEGAVLLNVLTQR